MPVQINELGVPVDLFDRTVEPGLDASELAIKLADLEARLQALESALGAQGGDITISGARIDLVASQQLTLSSPGGQILMKPNGIIIQTPIGLQVLAPAATVTCPVVTFTGIVKSDTVITNTVIATTYTPGVGNLF